MKKILVSVCTDETPSVFDVIVGYDGGADAVIPVNGVGADDAAAIVYDCVFTRGVAELNNTALFVSGSDAQAAEAVLSAVHKAFHDDFRVSVAADPMGAYSTASAAVCKIGQGLSSGLSGAAVVVLAGTGPIGRCTATLLAAEGARVTLTSRSRKKGDAVCENIRATFGEKVAAQECEGEEDLSGILEGAQAVVATGAAGVELLSKAVWETSDVEVLADCNAVAPAGIEGVGLRDGLADLGHGKKGVGAIAVGELKMRVHYGVVRRLFETNTAFFDLEATYEKAKDLVC